MWAIKALDAIPHELRCETFKFITRRSESSNDVFDILLVSRDPMVRAADVSSSSPFEAKSGRLSVV
jgi:hypothetical protein